MTPCSKNRWLEAAGYLLVILAVVLAKGWVVTPANVYVMDDYSNLLHLGYADVKTHFRVLPEKIYSDRPVGNLFYNFLTRQWKLDYIAAHWFQFLVHMGSALMVFYILRRLALGRWPALAAACTFAAYPMSTMCVQWTAAVYDLFCMFFTLATIALYVYHLYDRNRMKYFTPVMVLLAYGLAARSKEMAIFLPFILALLAVYHAHATGEWKGLKANLAALTPSFIFFLFLFFSYVGLYTSVDKGTTVDPKSPYYVSFSPLSFPVKIWNYLMLHFDVKELKVFGKDGKWHETMHYQRHLGALIAFLACSLALVRPARFVLIAGMYCFSLLILMPVRNIHPLYLYVPSFFIVFLLAEALEGAMNRLKAIRMAGPALAAVVLALLATACYFADYVKYGNFNRQHWLTIAKIHRDEHQIFRKNVKYLNGNEKFLIYNAASGADIFTTYGPGNSIRLYTGLPKLDFTVMKEPAVDAATKAKFDVVINANKGKYVFEKLSKSKKKVDYLVKL